MQYMSVACSMDKGKVFTPLITLCLKVLRLAVENICDSEFYYYYYYYYFLLHVYVVFLGMFEEAWHQE